MRYTLDVALTVACRWARNLGSAGRCNHLRLLLLRVLEGCGAKQPTWSFQRLTGWPKHEHICPAKPTHTVSKPFGASLKLCSSFGETMLYSHLMINAQTGWSFWRIKGVCVRDPGCYHGMLNRSTVFRKAACSELRKVSTTVQVASHRGSSLACPGSMLTIQDCWRPLWCLPCFGVISRALKSVKSVNQAVEVAGSAVAGKIGVIIVMTPKGSLEADFCASDVFPCVAQEIQEKVSLRRLP